MRHPLISRSLFLCPTLMLMLACTSQAQDVVINFNGDKAEVTVKSEDSIDVKVKGTKVKINSQYLHHTLSIIASGNCPDGQIVLKSDGNAKLQLNGLSLTSNEGAPLWLKNKGSVDIEATEGTANDLTITACLDTAKHKSAVVWAKGNLQFSGKGTLNLLATGNGCKGINAKTDLTLSDLTLNVTTKGDNLGKDTTRIFPPGGVGGPPPMGDHPQMGNPPMHGQQANFPGPPPGMHPDQFNGQPPMGPPPGGGGFPGNMASGDPDEPMKGGFKQRYISTTKAIKSAGTITINSGTITCTTSSFGAEGIEGKKGITVNDGTLTVNAIDDAINSGGTILFNGGTITAESHCNDAIDANPSEGGFNPFGPQPTDDKQIKPTIIITGGTVTALSHTGAPEEGIDSDFSPIEISGGEVFTIGGGMGEMPSVPTQSTAKQPTILFTGITLTKDEKLEILDGTTVIFSKTIPFSFRNSATLITCPKLVKGKSYTLRTKGINHAFTLSDNFCHERVQNTADNQHTH